MDTLTTALPDAAHLAVASFAIGMLTISLFTVRMAKRKGYSGGLLLWAWVPGVNVCALMVCSSLPDRHLRRRTAALADRLMPPDRKAHKKRMQQSIPHGRTR